MPHLPAPSTHSRTIIVTGMHRSGTSLMAGLLGRLGVDLGDRLIPADRWNQHGYHEDATLVEFHGRLFRQLLPATGDGHVDWGWLEGHDLTLIPELATRFRGEAIQLAENRARQSKLWGFKDPRTSLLLEFWDACLPDARYVFVYRAPWLVADSMQRIEADLFRKHPEYAAPIWTHYNRRILEFHRKYRDRSILVNVDALPAALPRLRDLLDTRIRIARPDIDLHEGFDASILRKAERDDPAGELHSVAFPECMRLYEEMEAVADLPSGQPHKGAHQRTRPIAANPAVVSIIIPTHNDAPLLLDALASVDRASPSNVEVVIVDDGSRHPESVRILDALSAAGHRIIRSPHRGLASARNAGIAAASGRYLLTLDADNRLLPGFVEAAVAALDADPQIGVVHSDWRQFGARTNTIHVPAFGIERMVRGNYIDACAIFRRSLWEDLGGYDLLVNGWEDWEFWLHAHSRGWRFHHLQRVGFEYRVREGSLLSRCCRAGIRHRLRDRILQRHPQLFAQSLPAGWRGISAAGAGALPARLASAWSRLVNRTYWHLAWEWAGIVQTCHPAKPIATNIPPPRPVPPTAHPNHQSPSPGSDSVFVVIPAYNGGEGLLRSIASIISDGLPQARIIIADNASSDGAPARANREFPGITVLRNQSNQGFAAACNRGIHAARSRGAQFILLLNQDARAAPGLCEQLLQCARQHPSAGIIGPRVCSNLPLGDGSVRRLYAGAWRGVMPLDQRIPGSGQPDTETNEQPCVVDFVYGCAMFLRTAALPANNTFDPAFFMYHEDVDLCLRMRDAGWQCWCVPSAVVWHDIEDLARLSPFEAWRWHYKFASARAFFGKRFRRPASDLLLAAHYLEETVRALIHQGPRTAIQLLRLAVSSHFGSRPETRSD